MHLSAKPDSARASSSLSASYTSICLLTPNANDFTHYLTSLFYQNIAHQQPRAGGPLAGRCPFSSGPFNSRPYLAPFGVSRVVWVTLPASIRKYLVGVGEVGGPDTKEKKIKLKHLALMSTSPIMISTVPLPRPISVNSSILPLSSTYSATHKGTSRCTSADIHNDDVDSTQSLNVSFEYHPSVAAEMEDADTLSDVPCPTSRSSLQFEHLPIEIHEAILDHLFGERASASGNNGPGPSSRSWVKALRHPRRKALSDLSLISPLWRTLVQERIFRHSEYSLPVGLLYR